jgi:phosphoserine phosphatase RsbU/P
MSAKEFLGRRHPAIVSNSGTEIRRMGGGSKMTSDAMVLDVSQDWTMAAGVQQRLMRGRGPAIDSLDYSAGCRQVLELGGDWYDFVPLCEHRLAVTIGDASGKSLPAALLMANVQASIRTAALFAENDPSVVLTAVNRQVHASSLAERYATLFYGIFDARTRTLLCSNAGHNAPVVVRRDGSITKLEATGGPVGMFQDSHYEEVAVHFDPGDMVIAYTDGVVEALSPDGEEWGLRGLLSAVTTCETRQPESIVTAAFAALDEFSRDRQTDDETILAALFN